MHSPLDLGRPPLHVTGKMAADCVSDGRRGLPLGSARRGFHGRVSDIHVGAGTHGLTAAELERRLLELGFLEGAEIELLHEGPLGGDPIAVRVNGATIALRRREAMAVLVV